MDEKGLGRRLQAARQAAGLTQQQLCHNANLSYSTLTKIERGAIKSPSIFTIQSFAAALGLSLDALLGLAPATITSPALLQTPATAKRTSRSGIRFVYFDMNDCLVRFRTAGFTQLARDSGQPIDVVESIYIKYDAQVCRGELSLDELNTIWAERLGVMVDWKKYYLQAVDIMPGITQLVKDAAEYYFVGILSNTMPGFIGALQAADKLPNIAYDSIVDSSVIHALKPEAAIFEAASKQANMNPDEILLIDDNRLNLVAAEKLGWKTIWFDSYQPEAAIASIRESLEL